MKFLNKYLSFFLTLIITLSVFVFLMNSHIYERYDFHWKIILPDFFRQTSIFIGVCWLIVIILAFLIHFLIKKIKQNRKMIASLLFIGIIFNINILLIIWENGFYVTKLNGCGLVWSNTLFIYSVAGSFWPEWFGQDGHFERIPGMYSWNTRCEDNTAIYSTDIPKDIGGGFSKDKNSIYLYNNKIDTADVKSFQILWPLHKSNDERGFPPYFKDKNSVYLGYKKIAWADVSTFEVLWKDSIWEQDWDFCVKDFAKNYYYSKDKNHVFYGDQVIDADVNSFDFVPKWYREIWDTTLTPWRDKNGFYCDGEIQCYVWWWKRPQC